MLVGPQAQLEGWGEQQLVALIHLAILLRIEKRYHVDLGTTSSSLQDDVHGLKKRAYPPGLENALRGMDRDETSISRLLYTLFRMIKSVSQSNKDLLSCAGSRTLGGGMQLIWPVSLPYACNFFGPPLPTGVPAGNKCGRTGGRVSHSVRITSLARVKSVN